MPKKIYYIWNYLEWGGAQIYFFGIIRRIREDAEICILLPENSDEQLIKFIKNLEVNYDFYEVEDYKKYAPTLREKFTLHRKKFKAESAMLKSLERLDLTDSIVHVDLAPWQSLYSLMRLSLKTRVFVTMHNSFPRIPKWRSLLWKAKFAVITKFKNFNMSVSNEDAKKNLKPFVSGKFYDKVDVTLTTIDPNEIQEALETNIDREKLLARHKIPRDKFLVFCVGQFIDRKGRWTFLEAAKDVSQRDENVAFVWIANSKPSPEDLRRAEQYGLGENFILITGDQVGSEHIDLCRLMRLADIFVLASFQEGLPGSLLEAMALGIPSISTNVNAIPEAIKHLETGCLVEAGKSRDLAKMINALKSDRTLREKLARNGREFVLTNFDERVVGRAALRTYQKSFVE